MKVVLIHIKLELSQEMEDQKGNYKYKYIYNVYTININIIILEVVESFKLEYYYYHTFHSYRFGYADFSKASEAKKAMNSLVGQELCGREIRLDIANSTTPKERTPRGG